MSGKNIDIPSHVNALWRTICLQTPEGLQIHIDRSQIEGAMNALAEEFRAEHLRTVDEYNKKAEADLRHIREVEETASRLRREIGKPRACDTDEIQRLLGELAGAKKALLAVIGEEHRNDTTPFCAKIANEKIQQLTERAEDAEQTLADTQTQYNELLAQGDKLEHERQEIENRYITLRTVAELCANELESLHKFHYHECKGDCPADTFAKAVRGCNLPELVEEASRKSKTNLQLAFDIVQKERIRQTSSEGYTPQHDDAHSKGELAGAAAVYALEACGFKDPHVLNVHRHGMIYPARVWPWADHYWKPSSDPIRNLAKAGALILAEIERIIRKSKQA